MFPPGGKQWREYVSWTSCIPFPVRGSDKGEHHTADDVTVASAASVAVAVVAASVVLAVAITAVSKLKQTQLRKDHYVCVQGGESVATQNSIMYLN